MAKKSHPGDGTQGRGVKGGLGADLDTPNVRTVISQCLSALWRLSFTMRSSHP